jgi:carboxylesterase type B
MPLRVTAVLICVFSVVATSIKRKGGYVFVETKLGEVRGKVWEQEKNKEDATLYAFFGVPFGESTAKYNRWKPPVPVKPWKAAMKSSSRKGKWKDVSYRGGWKACPQPSWFQKVSYAHQSEDCLNLGIFMPVGIERMKTKLPV